jgi:hypothetical protein
MRVLICRLLMMTVPLAGCASTLEQHSVFAQPGKYRFMSCKDLTRYGISLVTREQELNSLIDRANQGMGGAIISPMVYGPDLDQVRADERELKQSQNEKNCDAAPPHEAAAPQLR